MFGRAELAKFGHLGDAITPAGHSYPPQGDMLR